MEENKNTNWKNIGILVFIGVYAFALGVFIWSYANTGNVVFTPVLNDPVDNPTPTLGLVEEEEVENIVVTFDYVNPNDELDRNYTVEIPSPAGEFTYELVEEGGSHTVLVKAEDYEYSVIFEVDGGAFSSDTDVVEASLENENFGEIYRGKEMAFDPTPNTYHYINYYKSGDECDHISPQLNYCGLPYIAFLEPEDTRPNFTLKCTVTEINEVSLIECDRLSEGVLVVQNS